VQQLILMILQVYLLCVFGRIILSWFPVNPRSPVATISSFLYSITEPILGPIRNALPRVGMFDLSPIVVIFGIQILMRVIQRSM
jgi:YggT family protein